jgi:hypothetical protein
MLIKQNKELRISYLPQLPFTKSQKNDQLLKRQHEVYHLRVRINQNVKVKTKYALKLKIKK